MAINNYPAAQPTVIDNDADGLRIKENYNQSATPLIKNPGVDYKDDFNGLLQLALRLCYAVGVGQNPTDVLVINSPATGQTLNLNVTPAAQSHEARIVALEGSLGGTWKPPVVNATSLPPSGNTAGDSRVALDTQDIWVWSGSAWVNKTMGGIANVPVQDNGSPIVNATAFNFTGAGMSVSDGGGGLAVVNIPGGGGGLSLADAHQLFGDFSRTEVTDIQNPINMGINGTIALTVPGTPATYTVTLASGVAEELFRIGDVVAVDGDAGGATACGVVSSIAGSVLTVLTLSSMENGRTDNVRRWPGPIQLSGGLFSAWAAAYWVQLRNDMGIATGNPCLVITSAKFTGPMFGGGDGWFASLGSAGFVVRNGSGANGTGIIAGISGAGALVTVPCDYLAQTAWQPAVVNPGALPASGNNWGDLRATLDTFDVYVWYGAWFLWPGSLPAIPVGLFDATTSVPYRGETGVTSSGGAANIKGGSSVVPRQGKWILRVPVVVTANAGGASQLDLKTDGTAQLVSRSTSGATSLVGALSTVATHNNGGAYPAGGQAYMLVSSQFTLNQGDVVDLDMGNSNMFSDQSGTTDIRVLGAELVYIGA